MMWAEGSQFSADTIYFQLKDKKMDHLFLRNNSFIVSMNPKIDSSKFNQIKGKTITGNFMNGKLHKMLVDGNAESIYYLEENSKYSGMNKMVSSRMRATFDANTLSDILFINKPEGSYYPMNLATKDMSILQGFLWNPQERPKSKEDIIQRPTQTVKKIVAPPPSSTTKKKRAKK